MKRPSHKELSNRLREARKAVHIGRISVVNQLAVAADAIELEYDVATELRAVLTQLLQDIAPEQHYTGAHPPQRSYEQRITGLELLAFVVESRRFERRIYLKFALAADAFWLVSLHEDRTPNKEAS